MERKIVKILYDGKTEEGILEFSEKSIWQLNFIFREINFSTSNKISLFDCLCSLRIFLAEKNIYILCNGARIDAYPSRLAIQKGGMSLYVLRIGEYATSKDIVNIFDDTVIDKIGSVSEQKEFYEKWLGSLNAPVPTWDAIQEAKKLQGGGWLYAIDSKYDKDGAVPPTGIVGAWEVSPEGKIIGKFVPNPNYVKS